MPTNEIDIGASPDDVFAVLVDPYAYVQWVVGGRTVRSVDPGFPEPGTAFHHTAGLWPFVVKDNTKVRELEPGRRIVLEARARPVGTAVAVLALEPTDDGGTHVVFTEEPLSGPLRFLPRPLLELLTKQRNAESLRRLRNIVEERSRLHR
jgi:uncharacterized protein YndB with AHSA1/START domain